MNLNFFVRSAAHCTRITQALPLRRCWKQLQIWRQRVAACSQPSSPTTTTIFWSVVLRVIRSDQSFVPLPGVTFLFPRDVLPIYHVHGFLPQGGRLTSRNRVVLSERLYHARYSEPYDWSNLVQVTCFTQKSCLLKRMPDFAALDSSFLIALAGEFDGFREETIDRLGHERLALLISPTVRVVLSAIARDNEDTEIQDLAIKALDSLGVWSVLEWNLTPEEEKRSGEIVEMFRVMQIVDGDDEPRRVVAEAAIIGCMLLVSEREVLNAVNNLTLGFALYREKIKDIVIKSPQQINASLGPLYGGE